MGMLTIPPLWDFLLQTEQGEYIMGVTTPWCPRCGAWRGYVAKLCKGCMKIDEEVAKYPDPVVAKQELARRVQERFVKISEMRTDREAFTQALEEQVEQNVEVLKQVCMDWMRMRPESRRVRFANMYAMEMISSSRLAFEELGAISLELSKYTENKARHEETMQRVVAGMQAIEKFINPDANEPEAAPEEQEENEDAAPGSSS
jgi:hypothetical protein